MTAERITFDQLARLTEGRDRAAAHTIEQAVHGINTAEASIRATADTITSRITAAITRLDQGTDLNGLGELQHAPADFDRAVVLWVHHWKVLGALLTSAEIAALQPAGPPAR